MERPIPLTAIRRTSAFAIWGVALARLFLIEPAAADSKAMPAVIESVRTSDRESLSTLIAKGVDVDEAQGDGATALQWAAHRNDLAAATLLAEAGAAVNKANDLGATPLWLAAVNGSAPMIELLLAADANPNVSLEMGETPLMAAARSGNVDAVRLLGDGGADLDAAELERGQTALMWAAARKNAAVVRHLVEIGAALGLHSKVWYQLENTAGNTNPSANFKMAHGGSTALLFVARNGDVDTARALLDAGADIDDTAASGTSALVVAAHSGHVPLATYLLERGADPNAAGAGYTALHAAVLRGEADLVTVLLEHGADPNAPVRHGTPGRRFSADYSIRSQTIGANAFWLAAQYGELEILRLLAKGGADPFVTNATGASALKAAMGGSSGADNRRNRDGIVKEDAVSEEARTLEMARFILDLGIDVNKADADNNTPLHDAVRRRFAKVVELLAANGADLETANAAGQTPLFLAETPQLVPGTNSLSATRPKIAAALRRLGAKT